MFSKAGFYTKVTESNIRYATGNVYHIVSVGNVSTAGLWHAAWACFVKLSVALV